jgi:hypothetical protein
MRECPKCSSTYDDDAKICRTCGAILETIEERSAHPTAAAVRERDRAMHDSGLPAHDFGKQQSPADDRMPSSHDDDRAKHATRPASYSHHTLRQCSKCGSVKLIPDARFRDQGEYSNGKLQLVVDGQPDAALFKDSVFGDVVAEICGDCGHIELRAENPGDLYGHYVRSRGSVEH